jgi:hypothetical protein
VVGSGARPAPRDAARQSLSANHRTSRPTQAPKYCRVSGDENPRPAAERASESKGCLNSARRRIASLGIVLKVVEDFFGLRWSKVVFCAHVKNSRRENQGEAGTGYLQLASGYPEELRLARVTRNPDELCRAPRDEPDKKNFQQEFQVKHIPLTQGQFAIVDDADFEWLNRFKWCVLKLVLKNRIVFYAKRRDPNKKGGMILMHRQIVPGYREVDHEDGDGLNNRRGNLREATRSQNTRNSRKCPGRSSKFKGVYWRKDTSKWVSKIYVFGKNLHLGNFQSETRAADTYDAAAEKYFGEFALTNQAMNIS